MAAIILNLTIDGQVLTENPPTFTGTAPAGTAVTVTLNATGTAPAGTAVTLILRSTKIVVTVYADSQGIWSWTPVVSLEEGPHSLTVEYTDASNQKYKTVRFFEISAPGPSPSPSLPDMIILINRSKIARRINGRNYIQLKPKHSTSQNTTTI